MGGSDGHDQCERRYRTAYSWLVRLYPRTFRKRFAQEMVRTFDDCCHERRAAGRGLFTFAMSTYGETLASVVRERMNAMPAKKSAMWILSTTAVVLSLPLVAMRFTDEVAWTAGDFLIAAILLLTAGFVFEWLAGRVGAGAHRAAVGLSVATGLALIWMNLAVGLIGSENNPANLLYGGVLVVGIVGALIARFRPLGMARALFATAIAQASVPGLALVIFRPELSPGWGLLGILAVNTFFVASFAVSALLFRRARTEALPPA